MDSFKQALENKLFEQQSDNHVSSVNIQLAAAILMFEVIKADGDVDKMEVAEMVDILRTQFALESSEIIDLLENVHSSTKQTIELETFTQKLCKHWDKPERVRLLKDFWVIALADNQIDAGERDLIDRIAGLLELAGEEITRARYHAEQKLELNIN